MFTRLIYLSKSKIDGFEAIDIEKSSDIIFQYGSVKHLSSLSYLPSRPLRPSRFVKKIDFDKGF
ncbi:hypothetical protein [Nostoc sp.]|uniref:hypothetical protein n=1 Tax=Nostoc sp. TaxID=1180 RepID=UPI002FF6080E